MKVDKAVCTNDTLDDHLLKAIKYDVVFTTLVENKILAIKREGEERKRAKKGKRKSLGRLIFGNRLFRSSSSGSSKKTQQNESIDVEKGDSGKVSNVVDSAAGTTRAHLHHHVRNYDVDSEGDESSMSISIPFPIDSKAEESNDSNNGSISERVGPCDLVVEVLTHRDGHSYDDSDKDDVKDKESGQRRHSDISPTEDVRATDKDFSIVVDDIFDSPKDSTESLYRGSSQATHSAAFTATRVSEKDLLRLRLLEAKSISAQCSPILPRQKSTSLSRHSVSHPPAIHGILKSQVSYSEEPYKNGRNVEAIRQPSLQRNLNTCFSRQNTSEDSANLTISTFVNEQGSQIDSREGRRTNGRRTSCSDNRKSKSTSILVVTDKSHRKTINNLDSISVGSYQSNNLNLMRGLVSSFNQLTTLTTSTTTSNYFPVITTTVTTAINSDQTSKSSATILATAPSTDTAQHVYVSALDDISAPMDAIIVPTVSVPSDTVKLQRMTSTSTGSSVAQTGCCTTGKSSSKEKDKQRFKTPDWETGQSGSDDEYRKRKRKYKRHHRCSDPVLVYPSSGGLQHCILSMPPNQPIQFHYNDDFVYDMTLEVEPDQNGDLKAIVPSHRSSHRHHRHKKRHRHKKPKILVHDLDTQSVKVINPDDLSQRARWTIIATACLLLVMCLMLVGITLRMAPIIDDMGKYNNFPNE